MKRLRNKFPALSLHIPIIVALVFAGWSIHPTPQDQDPSAVTASPRLINTCLITANVDRLVAFYERILGIKATRTGKDYAEIHTVAAILAIFSAKAQEDYIRGSAIAGNNKGVILEFKVDKLDQEYSRLRDYVKTWVKQPATTPWGTRSMYFRDPDGNLVDFYEPSRK